MKPLLPLALCLTLSGCAAAWSWSGPGSRNGVLHGGVAAVATLSTRKLAGNGWYGAVGSCAYFAGHETEETRVWTEFYSGVWDSVLDVVVPCVVGIGLSLRLH